MTQDTIKNGSTRPMAPLGQNIVPADMPVVTFVGNAARTAVQIRIADTSVADDASTVSALARIVNDAYHEVEADIFLQGYQRTNEAEIAMLIQEGVLAIACLPTDCGLDSDTTNPTPCPKGRIVKPVGCVLVRQLSARLGNFGMLALESKYRGGGLGRAMIEFAEAHCQRTGCKAMQMELLVPTSFEHSVKPRMQAWYQRMGYQVVKLGRFDQEYPALATQLAGPADYKVFRKELV